jgi:hypothetical protein
MSAVSAVITSNGLKTVMGRVISDVSFGAVSLFRGIFGLMLLAAGSLCAKPRPGLGFLENFNITERLVL